ncbi:regulator [Vibrio furnissii]|uniref:regulator n=1 Tax=Vibrio furnissii TaxID=29494 RepID=UPI0037533587
MTKNYIFREFECGLTREQTAELCFKSARTISEWDRGSPIPPECKRLMRLSSGYCVSDDKAWEGFVIRKGKLQIPTGEYVTPQQILTGIALIEISSELEIKTCSKLIRYARSIAKIMNKN